MQWAFTRRRKQKKRRARPLQWSFTVRSLPLRRWMHLSPVLSTASESKYATCVFCLFSHKHQICIKYINRLIHIYCLGDYPYQQTALKKLPTWMDWVSITLRCITGIHILEEIYNNHCYVNKTICLQRTLRYCPWGGITSKTLMDL